MRLPSLLVTFLLFSVASSVSMPQPWTRVLSVQDPPLHGNDVLILQVLFLWWLINRSLSSVFELVIVFTASSNRVLLSVSNPAIAVRQHKPHERRYIRSTDISSSTGVPDWGAAQRQQLRCL